MSLSQTALQAVLAQDTAEVFLKCLTIAHDDLDETLRLINDRQDLVRTTGTFTAFPFDVMPPRQSRDGLPQARIVIDNVDQRVTEALRSLAGTRGDITVTYEEVLRSSPNTIEGGAMELRVDGINISPASISLDLSFHTGFLNAAFPGGQFAPSNAG